jgi:hypothetical protein
MPKGSYGSRTTTRTTKRGLSTKRAPSIFSKQGLVNMQAAEHQRKAKSTKLRKSGTSYSKTITPTTTGKPGKMKWSMKTGAGAIVGGRPWNSTKKGK